MAFTSLPVLTTLTHSYNSTNLSPGLHRLPGFRYSPHEKYHFTIHSQSWRDYNALHGNPWARIRHEFDQTCQCFLTVIHLHVVKQGVIIIASYHTFNKCYTFGHLFLTQCLCCLHPKIILVLLLGFFWWAQYFVGWILFSGSQPYWWVSWRRRNTFWVGFY